MSDREQCSPPEPGDIIWHRDRKHVLLRDGTLQPIDEPQPGPSLADRLADWAFCTECLRLRISPGHWLTKGWHS